MLGLAEVSEYSWNSFIPDRGQYVLHLMVQLLQCQLLQLTEVNEYTWNGCTPDRDSVYSI